MRITLEETVHGTELKVGTPIIIEISGENGQDQCVGYYREINEDGITICPSSFYASLLNSNCDFVIPMQDIKKIIRIIRAASLEYSIKGYTKPSAEKTFGSPKIIPFPLKKINS